MGVSPNHKWACVEIGAAEKDGFLSWSRFDQPKAPPQRRTRTGQTRCGYPKALIQARDLSRAALQQPFSECFSSVAHSPSWEDHLGGKQKVFFFFVFLTFFFFFFFFF